MGVLPEGTREVLGLWIENTEGAKFWFKVFNDLKTRGVADVLIAVTDGLKGIGEALGAVFPATTLQTCIVHLIRNSLDYASWKDLQTNAIESIHSQLRRIIKTRGRFPSDDAATKWPAGEDTTDHTALASNELGHQFARAHERGVQVQSR
jgi:transposase-like protein